MSPPNLLQEIASIIHGEGVAMVGCDLSVNDARAWLSSMEPSRPFCLVAEWSWLDLDSPGEAQERSEDALPPAIIYSNYVLFDSRYRFPVGGWVRSTMLVAVRDGFIFETRNTRYLLMGPGVRRTTSLGAVGSIR